MALRIKQHVMLHEYEDQVGESVLAGMIVSLRADEDGEMLIQRADRMIDSAPDIIGIAGDDSSSGNQISTVDERWYT